MTRSVSPGGLIKNPVDSVQISLLCVKCKPLLEDTDSIIAKYGAGSTPTESTVLLAKTCLNKRVQDVCHQVIIKTSYGCVQRNTVQIISSCYGT